MIDSEGDERMRECECAIKKRAERLIERAGISDAFKQCRFENYKTPTSILDGAKKTAQAYAAAFHDIERSSQNSLLLSGEVGCGKTMLGVCVLNTLVQDGVYVLYAPYRDMVMRLKSLVLDDREYKAEIERLCKPRVLYIDDLYKGRTDADAKYVYDVINARYLAKKPLVITTELTADKLLDVDEAVGSRIIQMCRDYIYELRGAGLNYRLCGLGC